MLLILQRKTIFTANDEIACIGDFSGSGCTTGDRKKILFNMASIIFSRLQVFEENRAINLEPGKFMYEV